MSEENGSGEIKTPIGSVSFSGKKTAEFIAILSLCLLGVMAYVIFSHAQDTKVKDETLVSAMKELATVQREGNCITSCPESVRESKIEWCKRMTR